ncbi:PH domain-containing protein, partial [Candidatus Saccharibacteria bacterium]|nr:PH domain-containing protein [Candidatus Saccharibacteria bacterium]
QRFIQITQKGLFHRAVSDISLRQVQSINYEVSGIQETLLGFGTMKVQTYIGNMEIKDLGHPGKIQAKFVSILRDEGIDANPYPAAMSQQDDADEEEIEESGKD